MFQSIHLTNVEIILEVLIAGHLFARFLPSREHYVPRLLLTAILCVFIAYYFPVPESIQPSLVIGWGIFMYAFFFLVVGISLYCCYKENIWAILFCTVSGQSVQTLSSSANMILTYGLQMLTVSMSKTTIYLITVPVTFAICFLIFSKKLHKNPEIKIAHRSQLLLAIAALFTELFLTSGAIGLKQVNEEPAYLLLIHSYAGLACIFILALEFSILSNKKLESDLMIMDKLLEEEKKQYQISKQNIQMINLKCHDLKHQIRRLRVNQDVIDREELKEIEDTVGIYDAVTRTGNDALDVILTEKSMLCERETIQITCMAQGERINFMSSSDIYSLFGNALDNAIEAVLRLSEPEKRNISINVRENHNMIIIHLENYFDGTLNIEDGLPKTVKNDTDYHGFGMKSIQMIAEKYQGIVTFHAQDHIFNLDVIIPLPHS